MKPFSFIIIIMERNHAHSKNIFLLVRFLRSAHDSFCVSTRKENTVIKKSNKSYPICENLFLFLVMEEKHICMENASFLVSLLSPNFEKLFLSDKTNVYL